MLLEIYLVFFVWYGEISDRVIQRKHLIDRLKTAEVPRKRTRFSESGGGNCGIGRNGFSTLQTSNPGVIEMGREVSVLILTIRIARPLIVASRKRLNCRLRGRMGIGDIDKYDIGVRQGLLRLMHPPTCYQETGLLAVSRNLARG